MLVFPLYRIMVSPCRWDDDKSHHRSTTSHRPCLSSRSTKELPGPHLHEEEQLEHPTTAATEKKKMCAMRHASHVAGHG